MGAGGFTNERAHRHCPARPLSSPAPPFHDGNTIDPDVDSSLCEYSYSYTPIQGLQLTPDEETEFS